MIKGKQYHVWYQDDTTTRRKELTFLEAQNGLLYFLNPTNNKQEILPVCRIVRIEEDKDEKDKEGSLNR